MKDKKFIIVAVVLIIAFAVALFAYLRQDEGSAIGKLTFQSADLTGEAVDDSIFADYDLTMVNVWGTFCSPCIEEMPDIEELYEEMQSRNVNIIGVISDVGYPVRDKEVYDEANRIVEDTGVTYQNILPDQSLQSKLLNRTTGVPTTVFVDREGNVIGKMVVGAQSKLEYQKMIEELLEKAN